MTQSIVITTIYEPTEAVIEFSKKGNYQLIVVGDRKTPANWRCENTQYLSVEQQDLQFQLAKIIPYNHYCRKMFGYLKAIHQGASVIIDTDDDNIPKGNWSFPEFQGKFDITPPDKGFINIYQYFTKHKIWPRGLPLKLIKEQFHLEKSIKNQECNIGVWQALADGDPDVDAIYRLTDGTPCFFEKQSPLVLDVGTITPYNSQNTAIRQELFPLLYLPSFVPFRCTDILRGLIAQPIMWLYNFHLGFLGATVTQIRHEHDYLEDFISEIPMYKDYDNIVNIVSQHISKSKSVGDNMYIAYQALLDVNIICKEEMSALEAWLTDIER